MYHDPMLWGSMFFSGPIVPLFVLLALWSIFWKGLALWHSAQNGQYWWFAIMLFLNTAGILEIVYLFAVAKVHFNQLFSSRV